MSEETIPVSLESELDAFFGQYTGAGQARGLVYGLTNEDGLTHWRGFGAANDDKTVPDADTVFPIASMSKSFVACAGLVARDRGFLSFDDPITDHVPEFVLGDGSDPGDVPTVGMLFSMRGGLTEDNSWVDPFIDRPTGDILEQVSKGVRLSHVPGPTFEYSNLGFTTAGLAVSRAVGQPLDQWVRETVLEPLGLTSTDFDSAVPDGATLAAGYSLDTQGVWVPFPWKSSDAFQGAGGMVSTVRDLAVWITWLGSAFRSGDGDHDEVLSRMSRRDLQRIHAAAPPSITATTGDRMRLSMTGYGLGLAISNDLHRGTIVSHSGGLPGFKLHMTWHPSSGHGAIVLTNSHRGNPIALCHEALGRVLERRQASASTISLWPETVALRGEAERLIRNWDDELAQRIFAPNIDFDRPLAQRRAEFESLVASVGPLAEPADALRLVSTTSPADLTWSIPGRDGELLCMIHLTPVEPAQIQEIVVRAVPATRPRAASPVDISPRRAQLGDAFITPITNTEVRLP